MQKSSRNFSVRGERDPAPSAFPPPLREGRGTPTRRFLSAAPWLVFLCASVADAQSKGAEKVNWGKIEFVKVDVFGTEYKDALKDAAKNKQYLMIFFT